MSLQLELRAMNSSRLEPGLPGFAGSGRAGNWGYSRQEEHVAALDAKHINFERMTRICKNGGKQLQPAMYLLNFLLLRENKKRKWTILLPFILKLRKQNDISL